jgi:NhaP-type Na+/H+ and K+/H+ antiporter
MITHWPQTLMIAWWLLTLGSKIGVAGVGKIKWSVPTVRAIEIVITAFVLFEGGFFSSFSWLP